MKVVIGIVVVVIIALVVGFVPIMEVPYTETVQYQDIETYYEDEPYQDTETYYVDEPYEVTETYTESVPLDYEVISTAARIEGTTPVVSVTVQNTDSVAGIFTCVFLVKFSGMTITKSSIHMWSKEYSDEKELQLKPSETKTATHYANAVNIANHDWSWNYKVTPDTKTVEKQRTVKKFRQVEKQRTVTKYRQVEKERTVTKQRPETHYKKVPIFEYLLSRF